MKIERGFAGGATRYTYDAKLVYVDGWAQIDTGQDASYFGIWTNPRSLEFFEYCEGDTTATTCETVQEYAVELAKVRAYWDDSGYGFLGIDPGLGDSIRARLVSMGLQEYMHGDHASQERVVK